MTPTSRSTRRPLGALVGAALILAGLVPAAVPSVLAVSTTVVINEIDYDQPGTDASEFIELKNVSGAPVDLDAYAVVLVNGTGGGATIYQSVDLPSTSLASGDYFVVCASPVLTANCDLDVAPETNLIQNGAPDAVGLTLGATLVDTVSYEGDTGAPYTEGSGTGLDDTALEGESLSRCPDGVDTDQNNLDFQLRPITPGATNVCADAAPTVVSTFPADGATGVATNVEISFTFSEPVAIAAGGVTLNCGAGDLGVTVNPGPTTFTLTTLPFVDGDECTVTIDGPSVTDVDSDDPPDTMAGDFTFSFIVGTETVTITPIHAIQTAGSTSAPGTYTVEAVVVGDYQTQGSGQLRGFFVQEEDADVDSDSATSEGIFVFCSSCPVAVTVGDLVRVTGDSSEFFGMSQLSATTVESVTVVSAANPLPTPASVELPVPGVPSGDLVAARAAINAYFEAFEGMLVTFPDDLHVSEYFELARYGQVVLREGGRPHTFTAVNEPDADGLIDHTIDLARRTVILDDADNRQNRPVDSPNTPYFHPVPGLSTTNWFRGGDTISSLTGVLHWSFAGQTGTDAWRIRPVTEAFSYAFTSANPRPPTPTVGGRLTVASFNVLNYFPTVDTTASNSVGTCGPTLTMDCRGADSAQEFQRQRTKLLAALSAIDADIFGLMEMENTPGVEPLADIVDGLPGYAYVDTGVTGTDAIRVGIIYKTATVEPVGAHAVLDAQDFVNPRNAAVDRNRPAVAQTFEERATGARFTVVVNHLKSKGSGCGAGDDDTTSGQGNCNLTRTLAAQALAEWLATDPTGSGDRDVLIIGDLNSYAKEDPIAALAAAGYSNLVAEFGGPSAYSFVFDGQLGYLDHALANATLRGQVTGAAEWHINADEIPLFDFNDDVRDAGEAAFEKESDALPLYEANAVRTSDHDPVIIGLDLLNLDVDFGPFAAPLANPPDTSDAKAGSVVSVRFGLDGDHSFDSFFGAPQTYQCGMPGADRAAAQSAGTSGFRFDEAADQYVFAWKSMKAWADSCRSIEFVLDDGTYRTASVEFRK